MYIYFRYLYKVHLFVNKEKLSRASVNLENVCLDGCAATVVPIPRTKQHSRNTRDRKKMAFACSECTDCTNDCL